MMLSYAITTSRCLLIIDYSKREERSKIKLLTSQRIHYKKGDMKKATRYATTRSKVASQSMWEHERSKLIDEIIQISSDNKRVFVSVNLKELVALRELSFAVT